MWPQLGVQFGKNTGREISTLVSVFFTAYICQGMKKTMESGQNGPCCALVNLGCEDLLWYRDRPFYHMNCVARQGVLAGCVDINYPHIPVESLPQETGEAQAISILLTHTNSLCLQKQSFFSSFQMLFIYYFSLLAEKVFPLYEAGTPI